MSESFPTGVAESRMVEPKVEAAGIEPARHSPRLPLVYFIQIEGGGPIKIGIAKNVWSRLASLQTSCPYELEVLGYVPIDDAFGLEQLLHGLFAKHRIRGEWFEPAQEILDYIASVNVTAEVLA